MGIVDDDNQVSTSNRSHITECEVDDGKDEENATEESPMSPKDQRDAGNTPAENTTAQEVASMVQASSREAENGNSHVDIDKEVHSHPAPVADGNTNTQNADGTNWLHQCPPILLIMYMLEYSEYGE